MDLDDVFSVAERSALVLDGEAWPIVDTVLPIDRAVDASTRARLVGARLHPALTVTCHTAAWVHGVAGLGRHIHVASQRGARADVGGDPRVDVHLFAFSGDDVDHVGRVPVTSPSRTLLDLLAMHPDDPTTPDVAARLLILVDHDELRARIDGQASTARRARIRRAVTRLGLSSVLGTAAIT